ncbi:MAG: DUF1800 domain-containing protein [Acidobacteriota bacterium]|nr:DUF1800 domain-containing protein [Acidobacteriota bacterium]
MQTRRESYARHLLRRAGFGATPQELEVYASLSSGAAIDRLLDFAASPGDIDGRIGTPGFAGVTTRGAFAPNTSIVDARQRWLFRMVHSPRPLEEKMALFWHNHFATAYSKVAGIYGASDATRMMAAKPSEDPGGVRGQLELLRAFALGNFRELLVEIARDPAMLVWLDGRLNVRARPQENFARELMELFTFGVGHFAESDVYAAARVFTGWNLARVGAVGNPAGRFAFSYVAGQHDTTAKEFTFAVYANGSRTIPARSAAEGQQDGLDLIAALARHPETARRIARRLYAFFVSETQEPPAALVSKLAAVYLESDTEMKPVVRELLRTPEFLVTTNHFSRYSWPVEFVVRALKEVGHVGFSVDSTLTPLTNMGQTLFEPPDVNGWDLGPGWFSTGAMLARMNFAAQLATNQRVNLRDQARSSGATPEALVDFALARLTLPQPAADQSAAYLDYLRAGAAWSGSDAQLLTKTAGLVHLMVGSGDYQLV